MSLVFDEVQNHNCLKGCDRDQRRHYTENDLCNKTLSELDQKKIRCVGDWGKEKIFHLVQYFQIFANGMKDKWNGNINYIEICSGPGRCIDRRTGLEFNGTALAILNSPSYKHIKNILFFDLNSSVINILNERILDSNKDKAKAFLGDYTKSNSICNVLSNEIGTNSLNLVLIDPTDCSLPFQFICDIKNTLVNVDFIINFASRTDINRNLERIILEPDKYTSARTKYSNFLNNSNFFTDKSNIKLAENGKNQELLRKFRGAYIEELGSIGLIHTSIESIRNYYELIFASTHKKGLDFWDKVHKMDHTGQRKLF